MFTLRDIQNRLDEMDVNYKMFDDGTIGFILTAKQNFRFAVFISIDSFYCRTSFYTGIHFPEYNMKVLSKINDFNKRYKIFSFHINEQNENELIIDGFIDTEYTSDIESVIDLIAREQYVLENLYPETQKLIWSN